MKTLKSLALATVLVFTLGGAVRAGDIDTPGKTSVAPPTGCTSTAETSSTTDEIMLELLLAAFSLM